MIYLAAAAFFTLALLVALVAIHMTVRLHWPDILLALRGELGAMPQALPAVRAPSQRRAAF